MMSTFFKHHRKVEHRDGSSDWKLAPVRKTIYSSADLVELFRASNRRYLEFLAAMDDPTVGMKDLEKSPGRFTRGREASTVSTSFMAMTSICSRPSARVSSRSRAFAIVTFVAWSQERPIRTLGRMLNRLRTHGLIKKIGKRYKYYLTQLGRKVITTALKLHKSS